MIAQTSGVTPFRFSTDDVRPCDRTAVWREVLGRVHLHLDVEQVGDAPLRATVESHRWSSVSFYFSDTTPVRASRTPEFVQDGDGDFRLLRADGAGYRYCSNGVDEVVNDGCSALLFNGVVGSVQYLGPCRVSAIRVRRTDLANAIRGFDDRALRHTARESAALRLLAGYTELLRREGPASDPVMAVQVANHVVDLVALALGASGDAAEIARGRGVRAARLSALKADIAANLTNPELSIGALAARQGVSPRYVRMLFESEGLSFTDFVLDQRLVRSQRMVTDPRYAGQRVSAIAFAAGFGDLSYFNRTFRRRFGTTPSDLRAQAQREN
jgi:AraC-like DNA-binding protein